MSLDPVLVHDNLLVMRGAERSFAAMAACWPNAPISALLVTHSPPSASSSQTWSGPHIYGDSLEAFQRSLVERSSS